MGLDSFFKMPKNPDEEVKQYNLPEFAEPYPSLCGGMFSGDGTDGSFRGKVYNPFIEELTGVSLYEEEINNETLREMVAKFEELFDSGKALDYLKEFNEKSNWWELKENELFDLYRVFKAFTDVGAHLYGWW